MFQQFLDHQDENVQYGKKFLPVDNCKFYFFKTNFIEITKFYNLNYRHPSYLFSFIYYIDTDN